MKSATGISHYLGLFFKKDIKTISFWMTLLSLAFITIFGHYDTFDYPNSSHLSNIRKVVDASNLGFYYQYVPGVAMESAWDDFFMAFAMSTLALVGNVTGIWEIGDWTLYVVQFFLLGAVFLLPFWSRLFTLPKWFYPVIPVFVVATTLKGILFYSWVPYWAQTVAALWIGIVIVHLWEMVNNSSKEVRWCSLIAGHFAMGLVAGTLGLIRYNSALEARVVIFMFVLFLIVTALPIGARKSKGWGKTLLLGVVLLSFQAGVFTPPKILAATWWARDQIYDIQPLERYRQHPVWIPVYLGLGYVKNSLGINWNDGVPFEHAKKYFPDIKYGTPGHELAVRYTFFKVIKEQPALLVRSIGAKIIAVSQQMGFAMATLYLLYLVWLWRRKDRWASFGGGLAIGAAAATPVITAPYFYWNLGLHGALFFWGIYSLVALINLSQTTPVGISIIAKLRSSNWVIPKKTGLVLAPLLVVLIALFPAYIVMKSMGLTKMSLPSVEAELYWTSEQVKTSALVKSWDRVPVTFNADGQYHEYTIRLPVGVDPVSRIKLKLGPIDHLFDFQIEHIKFNSDNGKPLRVESVTKESALAAGWEFSDVIVLDDSTTPPILGQPYSTSASPLTITSPPRFSTGELLLQTKFELPLEMTEVTLKIRVLPRLALNFFQFVKSMIRYYLVGL